MAASRQRDLPVDVTPAQVWREGDQHWKVAAVHNGVATLQRCTKGGQVLNPRCTPSSISWGRGAFPLLDGDALQSSAQAEAALARG